MINTAPAIPLRGRPRRVETAPTDAVRITRLALGHTQEEFAPLLLCSLSAVRNMERERRLPAQAAIMAKFQALAEKAGVGLGAVIEE